VDTQKKLGGKINYFPIKAVQSFNTETMAISTGMYLGDFAVLKFFGTFNWVEKARKLEFHFDKIALFYGALSLQRTRRLPRRCSEEDEHVDMRLT